MNREELAVIIFEECASKTRTSKECAEAIKLRTNLACDIEDTIRRFRQSGSGLEKAAQEVLTLAESCGCANTGGCGVVGLNNDYDTLLALFTQKGFVEPEQSAKVCTLLKSKGKEFDPNTVEECDEDYRCSRAVKVGESLFFIASLSDLRESATEYRAESIAESAWEMARDEVYDMDTDCLLEYGGYYDGVKSYDDVEKEPDSLLIELDA